MFLYIFISLIKLTPVCLFFSLGSWTQEGDKHLYVQQDKINDTKKNPPGGIISEANIKADGILVPSDDNLAILVAFLMRNEGDEEVIIRKNGKNSDYNQNVDGNTISEDVAVKEILASKETSAFEAD